MNVIKECKEEIWKQIEFYETSFTTKKEYDIYSEVATALRNVMTAIVDFEDSQTAKNRKEK